MAAMEAHCMLSVSRQPHPNPAWDVLKLYKIYQKGELGEKLQNYCALFLRTTRELVIPQKETFN